MFLFHTLTKNQHYVVSSQLSANICMHACQLPLHFVQQHSVNCCWLWHTHTHDLEINWGWSWPVVVRWPGCGPWQWGLGHYAPHFTCLVGRGRTSLCVIWRQSIQVTSFYALVIRSPGASFFRHKKRRFHGHAWQPINNTSHAFLIALVQLNKLWNINNIAIYTCPRQHIDWLTSNTTAQQA